MHCSYSTALAEYCHPFQERVWCPEGSRSLRIYVSDACAGSVSISVNPMYFHRFSMSKVSTTFLGKLSYFFIISLRSSLKSERNLFGSTFSNKHTALQAYSAVSVALVFLIGNSRCLSYERKYSLGLQLYESHRRKC